MAVLAIVVALLEIATTTGSGTPGRAPPSASDRVNGLLAGIPQHGTTLGQPTAPITLEIFGDLECLTTKNYFLQLLPAIIDRFVRTRQIQIRYRSFETDTLHPRVFLVQETAARAAGAQNKLWNFVETFYQEQGPEYTSYVTERFLFDIAEQVPGLSMARWNNDRVAGFAAEVASDDKSAKGLGFHDTPSFLIGRTGGSMKKLTGSKVVLKFKNQVKMMRNPVSLITVHDLESALKAFT